MKISLSKNKFDVSTSCNAIVDILIDIKDLDLDYFKLKKGVMHSVKRDQIHILLNYFKNYEKNIELGGSSLNTVKALAMLNKNVYFHGMISKDTFGEKIINLIKDFDIKSDLSVSDTPTGYSLILITPDAQRTMITYLGASCLYDEKDISNRILDTKIFHFSGYQFYNQNQKKVIFKILKSLKPDVLVSFDIADPAVVDLHRNEFLDIIENNVNILFANKLEIETLYKNKNIDFILDKLIKKNISIIKLGADGSIIKKGDEIYKIKPVKSNVIDTTAAGDMYAAGFLYGILSQKNIKDSANIASKLASHVISKKGAFLSPDFMKSFC